ncbi:beta/alpha barrel domain-containing protein [Brochothrix campestris]|uniref:Hydrolase n=1 Tax=Brochothrix campestris FSL F6-1037 TaxID=1265861 RepID=W7CPW8_9LIST|nr:hydrolase [Brochothrix campestris]EUJ37731.1 hypothetical protein BCAMP_09490 [Brochothrix campestris FSL F6-1037]
MTNKKEQVIPELTSTLRQDIIRLPLEIQQASGIRIFGKLIKGIIFSTDIAIIKNCNADAVIAIYPFTPHPTIIDAICQVADIPVLAGIGGGLTNGKRSVNIGLSAEAEGAIAAVVNAPTPDKTIKRILDFIDIPLVLTIVSEHTDVQAKLDLGIKIVNVSGGAKTAQIVRRIRQQFPDLPIIATGGKTPESIVETIEAGANAITYTPPSNGELFKRKMELYREQEEQKHH